MLHRNIKHLGDAAKQTRYTGTTLTYNARETFMPITLLDLLVIGIVLLSALLAMVRGFTREVLAIGSWAVAGAVAFMAKSSVVPFVQANIVSKPEALVNAVALGGVFIGTLLLAYIVTSKLSDFILDSRVGALDRTLGFIFGAVRGFLLAVIGFWFFSWLVKEGQQPAWVAEARFRPLLAASVEVLQGYAPQNLDTKLTDPMKQLGTTLKGTSEVLDAVKPAESVKPVKPAP